MLCAAGCASVQRIVADLIPQYALYCPTALEAAARVVINMHNWSLSMISRGEDADGVAFQTATGCIFGLSKICSAASSEAPTSSVIRGICTAVFENVLAFFLSSFEGKDIFHIVDKTFWNWKMQDDNKIFCELKQKLSDEDELSVIKLSRLRALCLVHIFFSCPKNFLAACFEFFNSEAKEGIDKGQYFLRQIMKKLDDLDVAYFSNKRSDEPKSGTDSAKQESKGGKVGSKDLGGSNIGEASPFPKICMLGLVIPGLFLRLLLFDTQLFFFPVKLIFRIIAFIYT